MASTFGGIKAGDSFVLATVLTNNGVQTPAILNAAPSGNGVIYYWETNIFVVVSSNRMPVFSATTTVEDTTTNASAEDGNGGNTTGDSGGPIVTSLLLKDTINQGGLGYRSDGVTLGNAVTASATRITNPTFAPWGDPYVLLASVPYTITNPSGATARIFLGNTNTSDTFPATGIIILPVVVFGACLPNGMCAQFSDPHDMVANWYCLTSPQSLFCGNVDDPLNPTWTSRSDANSRLTYSYCPVNRLCGDNGCRGPCENNYDDCNPNNNTFSCSINTGRFIATSQWYQSPYFIAAVIFVLVMIIIVIIVAISLARKVGQSFAEAAASNK